MSAVSRNALLAQLVEQLPLKQTVAGSNPARRTKIGLTGLFFLTMIFMNIIFDYNRTLFNPENNQLYEGVYEILDNLSKEHQLFLFSYNEFGREKFMKDIDITKFFSKIALVENKNEENMSALIENNPDKTTFIVGDRLRDEIAIGNKLGYQTIWLRKGKFASELPASADEHPKHTINSIEEIYNIIKNS